MDSELPLNLLLITCDQYRHDCLSCADHPVMRTPGLDMLATEGVRFASHFGQAAPCAPGRASLYTGQYLMNHRVVGNSSPLEDRHANFAASLRTKGYEPVVAGYTDICADPTGGRPGGADEVASGIDGGDPAMHSYGSLRGIASLEPGNHSRGTPGASGWATWLEDRGYDVPEAIFSTSTPDIYGTGTYPNALAPGMVSPEDRAAHPREIQDGYGALVDAEGFAAPAFYKEEHSESSYTCDLGLRHVRSRRGAPWALHVSTYHPHPPFLAAAPFAHEYHHSKCGGAVRAPTREEEGAAHPYLAHVLAERGGGCPIDEMELNVVRGQYFACCAEVDAALGRLFAHLKESGEWERTFVVFTADHGEQLGEHHLMSKLGFFDASYHLPCIVRDPRPQADATRGSVVRQYSEAVDIFPTICEAFGLAVPAAVDGQALTPFLQSTEGLAKNPRHVAGWEKDTVHFEYDFRGSAQDLGVDAHECSICSQRGLRWKYVQFSHPSWPPLLYDIQTDPDEMVNLAGEVAHVATLLECATTMLRWRMRHTDHRLTHLGLGQGGALPRSLTMHEGRTARL